MYGWMDGWMNEWMDGWTDGWMDGRTDCWDGWTMNGWGVDGWMNGCVWMGRGDYIVVLVEGWINA